MATALNLGNANGKTITLRNPDTNNSDITVEMDKVVVKDVNGQSTLGSIKLVGETKSHILNTDANVGGGNEFRISRYSNSGVFESIPFRIDTSGNVGIGVIPSAWYANSKSIDLGISGAIESRTNLNLIDITTNQYVNTSGNNIYKNSGLATSYRQLNGVHQWYTAPSGTAGNTITFTNAMTLDAGGLTVAKTVANSFPVINAQYDSSNYIYIQGRNVSDTTEVFLSLIGSAKKSAILANGTFQSILGAGAYGGTSDIKLKENIKDSSNKLEKLMQVRVVDYNFISDESKQKQIGVIAQEIEQIFPGMVYETKDTKQVEVEKEREKTLEDGTVEIEKYMEIETQETGETTKAVKYGVFTMLLVKAMQEQQEIINDLKTRLEILEGGK